MEDEETLIDVLIDVSKFLRSKGYKFSLIGGVAYSIVFEPRATFDIDLIVDVLDIKNFIHDLKDYPDFILVHEKPMIFERAKIERVIHRKDIVIDFLIAEDNYKRNAVKRSKKLYLKGEEISIVSVEDLIILKLLSHREVDILDVKNLLRLEDIDRDYINNWVEKLNLTLPIYP